MRFLFIFFIFLTFFINAQEKTIYDVQTLKIQEEVLDTIVEFSFIEPYLNGIAWLRQHVKENMSDFPMEEEAIASSRDQSHEAHKRWERYMRTLPVKIVEISDVNSLLSVDCIANDTISVCKDFTEDWVLSFKNNSKEPLSFEFELGTNSFIIYPEIGDGIEISSLSNPLCTEQVTYIGNGRTTIFMPANSDLRIKLPVVYSCDGNNGESYRTQFSENQISINYKLKLTGYIYNHDQKELYLATTLFDRLKVINLKF